MNISFDQSNKQNLQNKLHLNDLKKLANLSYILKKLFTKIHQTPPLELEVGADG